VVGRLFGRSVVDCERLDLTGLTVNAQAKVEEEKLCGGEFQQSALRNNDRSFASKVVFELFHVSFCDIFL